MESFAQLRRVLFPEQTNEKEPLGPTQDTILIIDDNVEIIEALVSLLQSRYHLITCLSYESAKALLVPEIKVVLLDIKMASKDGIEAFKLLKEQREDLEIIFHSAYPGNSEKAMKIEQLDHSGYLTKGEYKTSELLAAIEGAHQQRK